MTLDTRYIPDTSFQTGILDKDTAFPLAGGILKFYEDDSRTTPKEVFALSGAPPNYSYVSLGTEITLSSIGTTQDSGGNDIPIYFFPYDASGNLQLYYFTVESSGAIFQFSREGQPNLAPEALPTENNVVNYIPNGQFLLHTDIVADPDGGIEAGQITADITEIAPGGWTFERTPGSTSSNLVLFERIGSFVETPTKSPRYSIRISNGAGGDTYRDLRVKFKDVNKFASDVNKYTLAFQAKSNSGGGAPISINLIKNYGTGGSATDTNLLQAINLGTDYAGYDIPFVFGSNDGKTIGDEDDDFIQLAISFPASTIFDVTLDNFVLTDGDVQISAFPDTTEQKFARDSLLGPQTIPDYEGSNLYLPIILGKNGFEYDDRIIGNFILKSEDALERGQLWANGDSFRVEAYSADGIPYRRLYEKWSVASPVGLSMYGVGFREMYFRAPVAASMRLFSRSNGAVTPAADGAVPTGFTFTPDQPDPYIVQITGVAASGMTVSSYWTYHTTDSRKYIIWYEISGSGTQPAESADVYRKVAILTGDDAETVMQKTAIAVNSYTVRIPNRHGYFLRATDNGAGVDPGANTRLDRGDGTTGDFTGTLQHQQIGAHAHEQKYVDDTDGTYGVGDQGTGRNLITVDTGTFGGAETRPINFYIHLAVYY